MIYHKSKNTRHLTMSDSIDCWTSYIVVTVRHTKVTTCMVGHRGQNVYPVTSQNRLRVREESNEIALFRYA